MCFYRILCYVRVVGTGVFIYGFVIRRYTMMLMRHAFLAYVVGINYVRFRPVCTCVCSYILCAVPWPAYIEIPLTLG